MNIPQWADVALDVKEEYNLSYQFFLSMVWYIGLCDLRGFAKTNDEVRACAIRYVMGKRKVTAPGTQRRKANEKARRKLMANLPAELLKLIDDAAASDIGKQFAAGNDKAINSLVGMIMRQYKTDAALVKELLVNRLRPLEKL